MFYVSKDWYSCTNPGVAHCWICFIGVSFFLAGNNEGVDDSLKKICQLVPGNSSSLRYYRTLIMYFNSW